MSQPELFETPPTPSDDDDAWERLMERQRAYLELRYEQQRRAGLKRRNASREEQRS
jgi:hypothetical protein